MLTSKVLCGLDLLYFGHSFSFFGGRVGSDVKTVRDQVEKPTKKSTKTQQKHSKKTKTQITTNHFHFHAHVQVQLRLVPAMSAFLVSITDQPRIRIRISISIKTEIYLAADTGKGKGIQRNEKRNKHANIPKLIPRLSLVGPPSVVPATAVRSQRSGHSVVLVRWRGRGRVTIVRRRRRAGQRRALAALRRARVGPHIAIRRRRPWLDGR